MFKLIWIPFLLIGCASVGIFSSDLLEQYGPVALTDRRVDANNEAAEHYNNAIKPILENRCVVCHGCYDTPCQLKLSSAEGIMRGASKELVYNGTRILASEPSRLGIDAQTTEQWRLKHFFPVLNEQNQSARTNLDNSLLLHVLNQKQQHPLPNDKILGSEFSLGLDRPQVCPTPKEYAAFSDAYPLWGMPYALPALSISEHDAIKHWVEAGAIMSLPEELPNTIQNQIQQWETFLNQTNKKHQLTSRYVYEHIYLANLYFDDTPLFKGLEPKRIPKYYFKLIRSKTPPGLPIQPISTRRPYDKPDVSTFYYRLMRYDASIVAKVHMPYRLNQERMDWIKQLFIEPEYEVTQLPAYTPEVAANPFITFHDLPVGSRYRFMLEEAQFIIQGFIKGPVCRGQVALNVIDDHFWVAFVNPEFQKSNALSEFLAEQSDNLRLPGEDESNSGIATNWLKYSLLHNQFLKAKKQAIEEKLLTRTNLDLNLIWDGHNENPNAALTIFRHFDSSSVVQGWVGQQPKTAWLISYPLLERIHYLLVAEFDVYGNIGHQLMTRLYMDFLRMEGESNFLTLLPEKERKRLTEYWYRDTSDRVKAHLFHSEQSTISAPSIHYKTSQPINELYPMMKHRLWPAMNKRHLTEGQAFASFTGINQIKGRAATLMPEISLVYAEKLDQVFTLIRNSGHTNLTGLLYEEENRLPEEDYLTLVPGIVGAYPSAFYHIKTNQDEKSFALAIQAVKNEKDYEQLVDRFGVRRTHPQFWQFSDNIHNWFKENDPLNAGLLDYNRLENR
ncbi:MAG: fatty acid cis/trans isomerase [Gammaproteobacteria bacterium]|nr:fatty acid cis/trans isomerase [Gammaproteobacteria bacterium]